MDHREHSIYFDDYNTWDMWHLVPSSRPTPSIPEIVTNYIEIPGMSGSLDLSETLTGFPVYSNRTIEAQLILIDQSLNWMDVYMDVTSKLHGKRMKIRLVDDPDWYYEGRVSVAAFSSNADYSSIDIEVECDPFKISDDVTEVVFDESTFLLDEFDNQYFHLEASGLISKACQLITPELWVNGTVASSQTVNFRNSELNYKIYTAKFGTTPAKVPLIILSNFSGNNWFNFTMKNYVSGSDVRMRFSEKRL